MNKTRLVKKSGYSALFHFKFIMSKRVHTVVFRKHSVIVFRMQALQWRVWREICDFVITTFDSPILNGRNTVDYLYHYLTCPLQNMLDTSQSLQPKSHSCFVSWRSPSKYIFATMNATMVFFQTFLAYFTIKRTCVSSTHIYSYL